MCFRLMSLGTGMAVEDNVLDAWAEYLNFNERLRNVSSPLRGFFPTLDVVFIPVSNDGHQFVEVLNLKTNDVWVLDSKTVFKDETKKPTKSCKKGSRIENDSLSTIVHADFRRYLTSVGHAKAIEIFTADLTYMRMNCQINSKAASCGVYAMRHMDTFMGNTREKCGCGLDIDGRKLTTHINKLKVKYAAKILLSGCNIHAKYVGDLLAGKQVDNLVN
ncbi:DNA-binding domain-containing protein [Tanacetum coccineum]